MIEDFKYDRTKGKRFFKKCFYALHRNYLGFKSPPPINILFYPQWPSWKSGIHQTLMNLGIGITDDPSGSFIKAFFWEDRTFRDRNEKLKPFLDTTGVINYRCTDVSKKKVEDVFRNVFGYELGLDPLSAVEMVRKSNFNSMHDGIIVQGPVTKERGFVYEKLLDNQTSEGLYEDMRITYFCGIIPFVSLRYHSREDRFGTVVRATVEEVSGYLSEKEIKLIGEFCVQLGFEYGDLDLIRDKNDGQLYILDANPTPSLPPRLAVEPSLKQLMVDKWSEAFKTAFLLNGENRIENPEFILEHPILPLSDR